jgi:hypothetical protein
MVNEGHLRWVSEIRPFKKCIAKLFQNCVEIPFNLECIDFCNTLIDNNHQLPWYFKDSFTCEQHQRNNDLVKK